MSVDIIIGIIGLSIGSVLLIGCIVYHFCKKNKVYSKENKDKINQKQLDDREKSKTSSKLKVEKGKEK